jgi:hypothetical protein
MVKVCINEIKNISECKAIKDEMIPSFFERIQPHNPREMSVDKFIASF